MSAVLPENAEKIMYARSTHFLSKGMGIDGARETAHMIPIKSAVIWDDFMTPPLRNVSIHMAMQKPPKTHPKRLASHWTYHCKIPAMKMLGTTMATKYAPWYPSLTGMSITLTMSIYAVVSIMV